MEPELEQFVREQRDRQEIHDVLMRYCRGVDRGIPELITQSFWPEATIDTGIHVRTGEAFAREGLRFMAESGAKASTHFVGTANVELVVDTACSETYMLAYMILDHEGQEYTRLRGSRYIDRWERRNGAWKVSSRVVVDDWSRFDPATAKAGASYTGKRYGERGPDDVVFTMRREVLGR
jgi:hypothetical protein